MEDNLNLLVELPTLARRIAERNDQLRDYEIFRRNYGLEGSEQYSLADIGAYFDLTRERVRQLRNRLRGRLRKELAGTNPSGEVAVAREAPRLKQLLFALPEPLAEERIRVEMKEHYGMPSETAVPSLGVLLECLGGEDASGERLGLDEGETYWFFDSAADADEVAKLTDGIRTWLEGRPCTRGEIFSLAVFLNRSSHSRVIPRELTHVLELMPDIEFVDDDQIQIRLDSLPSIAEQAFRTLFDHGAPLHFREITRRINLQADGSPAGSGPSSGRSVAGALSRDSRFEPVGRTGRWALEEWKDVRTESVADLMEEELVRRQQPTSYDEILEAVRSHRADVPRGTIVSLAHMESGRFATLGDGRLALARWPMDPGEVRTSSAEVHKVVRRLLLEFLDEADGGDVSLSDAVRFIRVKGGLLDSTVRSKLSREDWARVIEVEGEKRLRIDRGALERHEVWDPRPSGVESPVHDRVAPLIRAELRQEGPAGLPVREIRDRLRRKAGTRDPTAYRILDRMEDVEKQEVDGVLWARLIDADTEIG